MKIHHILADGSGTESIEGKILNFNEVPGLKRIYEKRLREMLEKYRFGEVKGR